MTGGVQRNINYVAARETYQKLSKIWVAMVRSNDTYTIHTHTTYSLATTGVPRADKFGSPWGDAMAHIHMYTTLTHIHTPIQHSCTSPQACRHTDIHTCIIGRIGVNELCAYIHTHMHTNTDVGRRRGNTYIYTVDLAILGACVLRAWCLGEEVREIAMHKRVVGWSDVWVYACADRWVNRVAHAHAHTHTQDTAHNTQHTTRPSHPTQLCLDGWMFEWVDG
jgi:hypothetical protein